MFYNGCYSDIRVMLHYKRSLTECLIKYIVVLLLIEDLKFAVIPITYISSLKYYDPTNYAKC